VCIRHATPSLISVAGGGHWREGATPRQAGLGRTSFIAHVRCPEEGGWEGWRRGEEGVKLHPLPTGAGGHPVFSFPCEEKTFISQKLTNPHLTPTGRS